MAMLSKESPRRLRRAHRKNIDLTLLCTQPFTRRRVRHAQRKGVCPTLHPVSTAHPAVAS